jgi:GNAT superfamily N-acetyltransferase
MAVLREWRGQGVGSALLASLMDIARELGMRRVLLNAQVHALPFLSAPRI